MKRGSKKNRLLDRYVGIPIVWTLARFKRRKTQPDRIRRIGILVSPTIGDNLISSVVPQDLRRHYPDSIIVYFVAPSSFGVVDLLPAVDQTVAISMTNPIRSIKSIRAQKLDLLLDLTPWQRLTALYAALSTASLTVGFASDKQYRHANYDLVVQHSNQMHELDNYRALVRALGIDPVAFPALKCALPSLLPANQWSGPLVLFHPWASGERGALREWPRERWIDLAVRLSEFGCTIVVSGAPVDEDRVRQLCALLKKSEVKACPLVSSAGFAAILQVLENVELVVSVNTGIMHLAAIAGAPTVGLSGPTSNLRWGPVGARVRGLGAGPGCGFLHFGWEFEGQPTDCMHQITVNQVLDAAASLSPHFHPRYREVSIS